MKLLRVLQEKQFQRVGGEKYISPKFRLLAATNKDLKAEVKKGNFRSDLFFRINVVQLVLPPLRERPEDIPLLVDFLIREKFEKLNRNIPEITPEAMNKIKGYAWPGNVRELDNFLERTMIFFNGNVLGDEFLALSENEKDFVRNATSDDL